MEAIVLDRSDIREVDQIITVLTREGKKRVIARGVKKMVSKLSAFLELFFLVDMDIIPGGEIELLITAMPINAFSRIRKEWQKSLLAQQVLLIVNRILENGVAHENIFLLLQSWLEYVDKAERVSVALLDAFVFRLCGYLGFRPELTHCVFCSREEGIMGFAPFDGGVCCAACGLSRAPVGLVSCTEKDLVFLSVLLYEEWGLLDQSISGEQEKKYHVLVYAFFRGSCERKVLDWGNLLEK